MTKYSDTLHQWLGRFYSRDVRLLFVCIWRLARWIRSLGGRSQRKPLDGIEHPIRTRDKIALCVAASRGQVEVVKLLLEKGTDVDVKDGEGKSACELAEANQHYVCANILRNASARASGNGSELTHRSCNFL